MSKDLVMRQMFTLRFFKLVNTQKSQLPLQLCDIFSWYVLTLNIEWIERVCQDKTVLFVNGCSVFHVFLNQKTKAEYAKGQYFREWFLNSFIYLHSRAYFITPLLLIENLSQSIKMTKKILIHWILNNYRYLFVK